MEPCRSVLRVAEAEFDAGGNEAGGVSMIVADATMDHDVDGVAFRDEQIDGAGKLQRPALAGLDAANGIKIDTCEGSTATANNTKPPRSWRTQIFSLMVTVGSIASSGSKITNNPHRHPKPT